MKMTRLSDTWHGELKWQFQVQNHHGNVKLNITMQ
jgi:hypothetical protein